MICSALKYIDISGTDAVQYNWCGGKRFLTFELLTVYNLKIKNFHT